MLQRQQPSMAENDASPSWSSLEERMSQKLSQLTKLMEHFGSHSSEDSDLMYPAFAEHNDGEIEQILKETACRIRSFKEDLEIKRQDKKTKEAVTNAKERERSIREAAEQQYESLKKEIMQLRSELDDQSEKLQQSAEQNVLSAKQHVQEIQELKRLHAQEVKAERQKVEEVVITRTKVQRELEAVKQMHLQQEIRAKEEARKEVLQSLEVLKAVHAEEIAQMQMENKEYVKQLSDKHAAAISRHEKEVASIKKKMDETIEERGSLQQEVHALREQLREAHDMLQTTSSSLAQDRDSKTALQISYSALKSESSIVMEKLRVSLKDVQLVSTNLESEKKKSEEMKAAYTSTISALESKTLALQKEIGNLTTACALNEEELKQSKKKVDELHLSLATSRKDHNIVLSENRRLQEEVRATKDTISKLEVEMRSKEADAVGKTNALSAEISALQLERLAQSEQSAHHFKELMDLKLKQQISYHESTMNSVQRAFLMQLDEQKKGAQVQVASLEESIRRKWKQSEAKAKEDYAKFAFAFESRLEQQRTKSTELLRLYEAQVSKLQDELESLASTGTRLEKEIAELQKHSLKQAQLSKQVVASLTRQLTDSQRRCENQQRSLKTLQEHVSESEAKLLDQAASIEELKMRADESAKAAMVSADKQRNACTENELLKETVLGLQLEHDQKLEMVVQNHKMELLEVREKLEEQKEAGNARVQEAMQSRLDKEAVELRCEMKAQARQHEAIILELQAAICEAAERHQSLVLAHQLDLEVLDSLRREKQADSEAFAARLADASARRMAELEHQQHQFSLELESIAERHSQEITRSENLWQAKLELKESQAARQHEADLADLRRTTRRWHSLEKEQITAEHKRTVCQLESRIADLERSISHKDIRISKLVDAHQSLEEMLSCSQLECRRNRELVEHSIPAEQVCRSLEEQRSEMQREFSLRSDESQSQHAAELDACREQHRTEMACASGEWESTKASMEERLQTMQLDFDKLQDRFHSKESNPADLLLIGELQRACDVKDASYRKLSEEAKTLKLEIMNREENYNKVFGNTPNVLHGVVDWLKPKNKGTRPSTKTGKRLNSSHSVRRTPDGTPLRTPDSSSSRTPDGASRRSTSFEH